MASYLLKMSTALSKFGLTCALSPTSDEYMISNRWYVIVDLEKLNDADYVSKRLLSLKKHLDGELSRVTKAIEFLKKARNRGAK